jgi:uncharacterized protein (DUF952 family)
MSDAPNTAFKILTAEQMHALEHEGVFAGAPIDLADGYIHLSTAAQLVETLDKHFADPRNCPLPLHGPFV